MSAFGNCSAPSQESERLCLCPAFRVASFLPRAGPAFDTRMATAADYLRRRRQIKVVAQSIETAVLRCQRSQGSVVREVRKVSGCGMLS